MTARSCCSAAASGSPRLMSMLESDRRSGTGRPTWYVHGAENGRAHAMGEHARELAAKAPNVTVRTFYQRPRPRRTWPAATTTSAE